MYSEPAHGLLNSVLKLPFNDAGRTTIILLFFLNPSPILTAAHVLPAPIL